MEEDMDPFPFILAAELGMTVEQMLKDMPNTEYFKWRAFFQWRHAQRELADKDVKP